MEGALHKFRTAGSAAPQFEPAKTQLCHLQNLLPEARRAEDVARAAVRQSMLQCALDGKVYVGMFLVEHKTRYLTVGRVWSVCAIYLSPRPMPQCHLHCAPDHDPGRNRSNFGRMGKIWKTPLKDVWKTPLKGVCQKTNVPEKAAFYTAVCARVMIVCTM